ncbi:chaB-like protein [Choristoneura murinana nucleopolyhedrovirus]|uniref:ChaB-like protein n=1 Tax=Choristoneura murinana nucleopolyhedrovirus TaxID=1987479 RepID=V9XTK7_9ABAC|nr:chaB-like protein [Choristoneura murinana nucleopolyhedrovirus]AHD25580.1 chaB-like protein [Choristoneura murinana nucleopolyhedrovirus]BBU37573.1 chaB-like protein [Choristoneura diversana nucleopolyhedrovirus]
MYHLPDTLYEEEKMPRRAKQLFVNTFSQHHKLNAGDEGAAMQKARQALEERYVRVNDSQWIPRRAAYEIIRDDMSSDSEGPRELPPSKRGCELRLSVDQRRASKGSSISDSNSASSSDDELLNTGEERTIVNTGGERTKQAAFKKKRVGKMVASQKYVDKTAGYSTDEDDY